MTGFTPKFFSLGTGVLQKQFAHRRLGKLIVHLGVTGLADFHAGITFTGLFVLFGLRFCRFFWGT